MKIYARIRNFNDLRAAIVKRKKALCMSNLALDDAAKLQQGYTGKLLCGSRDFGDMSLTAILEALGVELVMVRAHTTDLVEGSDFGSFARGDRKKDWTPARSKGGKVKALRMTAEERSKMARELNKIRWANHIVKRRVEARIVKVEVKK